MNWVKVLSVASLLSVGGCVTGLTCPPLVTYSKEFQKEAANELRQLPPNSKLGTMVTDYGKLQRACRAIEND